MSHPNTTLLCVLLTISLAACSSSKNARPAPEQEVVEGPAPDETSASPLTAQNVVMQSAKSSRTMPALEGDDPYGAEDDELESMPDDQTITNEPSFEEGPLKEMFGSKEGFEEKMNVALSEEDGGDEGFGRVGGLGKVDTTDDEQSEDTTKKKSTSSSIQLVGVSESCDDEAPIKNTVNTKEKMFRYCYEKALQDHPDLAGSYELTWDVGTDGKVSQVRDGDHPESLEKVYSCTANVVKRLRFAKLTTPGCLVTFSFAFAPDSSM